MRLRASSRRVSAAGVNPATSKAQVVTRNVGYNFAAQIWFLVLALVTTPYIVRELGVQTYGLFALIVSLTGYFAFLDLGLGTATVKYLSEFRGRGDDDAVGRIVGTSVAAYLLLGAVGGAGIALFSSFLAQLLLDLPADQASLARAALFVAAVGFLVNMPLTVFSAIPNALQRMDLANRRNILFGTVSAVGTVAILWLGFGLLAVLAFTVAVSAAASVSFVVLARRLLPSVSFRPRLDFGILRLLAGFGSLKFTNQVATQTVYHLDKLLVAVLASVSAVTYYAVPVTIAQRLAALVGNVSAAFLPAASELYGEDDRKRFAELYFRSTKLVALVVFPIGSLLFFFSEPILRFWLGGAFAVESSAVLKILAAGYVLNALSAIPAIASDAVGRPRVTTAFSVASAVLNVALSVLLIPPFGIVGASLAILVNSLVLVPLFIHYVHRKVLDLSSGELARRSVVRPGAAMALSWVPMALLASATGSLLGLFLAVGLSLAVYVLLSILLGVYDERDKRLAREYATRAGVGFAALRVRTP
jgi:O-antigen/teichoic acid export membrane protein